MSGDDRSILEFQRVTLYGKRGPIVRDISFELPSGSFGVLFGPSGGGKTTLLRLAHFDRKPDVGSIRVGEFSSDGISVAKLPEARRRIGVIFQDYKLLFDRSAGDNVALALEIGGCSPRTVRRRTMDLLGQVGLAAKRNMPPVLLSGGEQQRLCIARALAFDPEVLLADEPTGNLDQEAAESVMALIRRINHRGTTVLLATHDLELVRGYGCFCWQVEQGRVTKANPV